MKTIEILGENRFETFTKTRSGSRAIIIRDGKLLLSHETNSGWWLIPGGGLEAGETPEMACIREVEEETGYIVRPVRQFLTMNEYYEEYRYVSDYFVCEVTGKGRMNLTDAEIRRGVEPQWIPFREAVRIFSEHESYAGISEEKRGSYQREYTALQAYMEELTNIIFVRHAQSVFGENDRTRPLSEEGLCDRGIVLDTLKARKIDVFLCSPYKRSLETIQPAADYFRLPIHTDERLRERKAGSHEGSLLEKRWADFTFAEEGGENLASVQARNTEALAGILREYQGKTVVIGTHGTALGTILNHYSKSFGVNDFLRIVNWMPYLIELRFDHDQLVEMLELAHVEKQ